MAAAIQRAHSRERSLFDGRDGAHHEIAAGDQHQGIDGAGSEVEVLLRFVEQLHVVCPRKSVGDEENAESQQFGEDEKPDRQIARRCGVDFMRKYLYCLSK